MKYFLLFWSLIVINLSLKAQTAISIVNSFDVLKFSVTAADSKAKAEWLKQIESGKKIPVYSLMEDKQRENGYTLLNGETGAIALDIQNQSLNEREYLISTNLPENWKAVLRRQALLTDFYTYQRRSNSIIDFFGDAIPKLIQIKEGQWQIKVKGKEVVRIFLEFRADENSFGSRKEMKIIVTDLQTNKTESKNIPLQVFRQKAPNTKFTSIIYNNNSHQIAFYADDLITEGFTHQMVTGMPTAKFDKDGNMIGSIDNTTASSKEFRYVTNYWVGRNMPIIIYWQNSYSKLAPLADGKTYLKVYSQEWKNAYINLVNACFKSIKLRYPNIRKSDVILYVQDEISSGKLSSAPSQKVVQVSEFLKYIKQKEPEYKTFLTLGYYSFPSDLDAVFSDCDILCPHIIMPERLNKNAPAFYNPVESFNKRLYSRYDNINLYRINKLTSGSLKTEVKKQNTPELWSYLVAKGKTSNILEFRALPLYAILLGREGLSWWAFSDKKGSSWLSNDFNMLDYSMVYYRETNNPLYKYWCKDESERLIPSMRLYAARAGIQDAKILRYIIENIPALSGANKKQFSEIISNLSKSIDEQTGQVDEKKYLTLSEYEEIGQQLRKIYVSLL